MIKRVLLIPLIFSLLAITHPNYTQAISAASTVGTGTPTSCTETALRTALANNKIITFNCGSAPVTIPLNSELVTDADHIIYGDGKITLDGQGKTRIFHVKPYKGLMLDGLTLKNGKATNSTSDPAGKGQGGAIFVDVWSGLTVQNVTFLDNKSESPVECSGGGAIRLNGFNIAEVFDSTFTGNTAGNGGAINNLTSDLVVRNSLFDSNQATHDKITLPNPYTNCDGGGGAIFIDGASPPNQGGSATITITNSVFRNNKTMQSGGAVFTYLYSKDTLSIDQSTFEGNQAFFTKKADGSVPSGLGMGGALYWASEHSVAAKLFKGKYVVTNSTFSGNHADRLGGAIFVSRSTLELTNDTLANNEATNDKNMSSNGYRGMGGGLYLYIGPSSDTPLTSIIKNVTIANNSAGYTGGGISGSTQQSSMLTKLQNTVVANNTAAGSSDPNCSVTLTNLKGNVQPGGGTQCSSSVMTGSANLGTLGNYGGPTKTVPLQSGSVAINHGVPGCPSRDQRGYGRNGTCDSGAFEYNGLALDEKLFVSFIKK